MTTRAELIEAAKEVLPHWTSTPPFSPEQLEAYEKYFKVANPQSLLDVLNANNGDSISVNN